MIKLEGASASPGFAQAPAFVLPDHKSPLRMPLEETPTTSSIVAEEQRLAKAREQVARHLDEVRSRAEQLLSPQQAQVFATHKMLLYDVGFYARIEKELERGPYSAEVALKRTFRTYEGFVNATEHESFQLKLLDLEDVWRQVMSCLQTGDILPLPRPNEDVVIVANTFYPSQFAQLPLHHIKGLVTATNAPSSVVAEIAKTLNIPYFCDVQEFAQITNGAQLVLDGMASLLLVSPQEQIVEAYSNLADRWHSKSNRQLEELQALPSETRCGRSISLRADIKGIDDLRAAIDAGASGIGDLCTASLFLERGELPNQADQVELYRHFIDHIKPSRVAFRTLDLRADRSLPQIPMPKEQNPLLGWRGIRVTLAHRRLLLSQLTALLYASEYHAIRIVLPTVTSSEEIEDIAVVLDEAFQEVQAQQPGRMSQYQLGISVETVAAAMQFDLFASRIDFVSVDTDSLLQMVMAAERGNPRLLHLLSPMQPGFLRFLYQLCNQAHQSRLGLLARGSMASEPLCIPFLLGLGFREISVAPHMLANVKRRLRQITIDDAVQLTQEAMNKRTLQEVIALAHAFADKLTHEAEEADEQYMLDTKTARGQVHKAITASGARRTDDVTAKEK